MKKYFDVLKKCPLFNGIKEEKLGDMLLCLSAKEKSFKKGDTVLAEGDSASVFGIVLKGSVQLIRIDYYGNRSILASLGPGQLFGEAFACASLKALPIDITVKEDTVILLIDASDITKPCKKACAFHSQLILNLLSIVSRKNLLLHQKIEITSKRSTREKLLTYLFIQAKQAESNTFSIPYNRQELSDYLGVERSGLSVQISKLQHEKVLKCKRNVFTLL